MSDDLITTDLADFALRERALVIALLQAWQEHGLPGGFDDDGVKLCLNTSSGYVFLTNSNFDVAMLNGESLEVFHSTPYDGHEGFLSDLLAKYSPDDLDGADEEYLRDCAEIEGCELPESWLGMGEDDD